MHACPIADFSSCCQQYGNYCRATQATDENRVHVHCMREVIYVLHLSNPYQVKHPPGCRTSQNMYITESQDFDMRRKFIMKNNRCMFDMLLNFIRLLMFGVLFSVDTMSYGIYFIVTFHH
jgi:hypothetical protein